VGLGAQIELDLIELFCTTVFTFIYSGLAWRRALSQKAYFPKLRHVDMSGCFLLTGGALESLVGVCPALQPSSLYYCDNIVDGPWPNEASGCRNLECSLRVCCRTAD